MSEAKPIWNAASLDLSDHLHQMSTNDYQTTRERFCLRALPAGERAVPKRLLLHRYRVVETVTKATSMKSTVSN